MASDPVACDVRREFPRCKARRKFHGLAYFFPMAMVQGSISGIYLED